MAGGATLSAAIEVCNTATAFSNHVVQGADQLLVHLMALLGCRALNAPERQTLRLNSRCRQAAAANALQRSSAALLAQYGRRGGTLRNCFPAYTGASWIGG